MNEAQSEENGSRRPRHRWLFRSTAIIASLVLCEFVLHIASALSPTVRRALLPEHLRASVAVPTVSPTVPDPILGYRGNPASKMFDSAGFPNTEIPDHVDVVVIGDSQTQCPVGEPYKAWPAVLGRLTNLTTYNMGIGGWGPIDYLSVLDEALAHEPRAILVGVYLGNDLFDAYRVAYHRHHREDLRTPEAIETVNSVEASAPIHDEMLRQFTSRAAAVTTPSGAGCRAWLSEHGKLYGAARLMKDRFAVMVNPERVEATRRQRLWRQQVDWAERYPDRGLVFERGGSRTILTPARRHMALDLTDPRMAEGLALSLRVLDKCDRRCREAGVSLGIVLIPTKESAFHALADAPIADRMLAELIKNEEAVRSRVVEYLDERRIAHVDALGSLSDHLANGEQPYPMTRDGHPNVLGYQAIAEAAATLLKGGRLAMSE